MSISESTSVPFLAPVPSSPPPRTPPCFSSLPPELKRQIAERAGEQDSRFWERWPEGYISNDADAQQPTGGTSEVGQAGTRKGTIFWGRSLGALRGVNKEMKKICDPVLFKVIFHSSCIMLSTQAGSR